LFFRHDDSRSVIELAEPYQEDEEHPSMTFYILARSCGSSRRFWFVFQGLMARRLTEDSKQTLLDAAREVASARSAPAVRAVLNATILNSFGK
jgi:hypothetical protein